MAAEGGRAARRDGAHDAALVTAEMTDMGMPERFAVAAEDIRHLQCCSHDARSAGRHDLQAEPIEWARRLADSLGGDPGVARRTRQASMYKPTAGNPLDTLSVSIQTQSMLIH